ncbi:MAG: hypothetical protein ACI9JY_002650, partial [Saprospiraceae bacterium]
MYEMLNVIYMKMIQTHVNTLNSVSKYLRLSN